MIDFAALPPEINSARMYAGAGSSSLVAAASAWNALAAELNSSAMGISNVVTELSGDWLGPASATMVSAATPYAVWLQTAATQAEQTATQASAAAAAFERAFASVVPPPVIAENRAILTEALETNIFGQNNGVIAQLEAQYAEMWAQDSAAMFGYAGESAAAAKVTPFTDPPPVANPAAPATQGAAVGTTAATTAAGTARNTLAQLVSSLPHQLQALAAPKGAAGSDPTFLEELSMLANVLNPLNFLGALSANTNLSSLVNFLNPFGSFLYNNEGLAYFTLGMSNMGVQLAKTLGLLGGGAPAAAKAAAGAAKAAAPTVLNVPRGAFAGLGGVHAPGGADISIALGQGSHLGGMSVPNQWPGALSPALGTRPMAGVPVSEVISGSDNGPSGNVVGGVPAGAFGGAGRGAGSGPRYGIKPTIMARPLSAGYP